MRSLFNSLFLSMILAAPVIAEPRAFSVNDRSGQYLVEVLFPEPPEDPKQLAPGVITIRDSKTLEVLQQLQTQAGNVPVDRNGKVDAWLLGPFSLLYFDDFNFDGRLDLAIRNGTDPEKDYKGRFDVYLQDPQKPQWVLNQALTDLAKDSTSGLFSVSPLDGMLLSYAEGDCCWNRRSHWKVQGGELVLLHSETEEQIQPSEPGENSSMPSGYVRHTVGDLKDGQWQEQTRLEGPTREDPMMFTGKLDNQTPIELWYEVQGTVVIGELRYIKKGKGVPIKLVGSREDEYSPVILHEYADDGLQTGSWRLTQEQVQPFNTTGTRVGAPQYGARKLKIALENGDREPDHDKLGKVEADQRSGHYQMRQDALGRDGDLDLKILPERDAQGREVAEFTVTLKGIVTEHQIVPMESDNLIIVRTPQAPEKNGPYHIQLLKNFAVIGYTEATDAQDALTGMYLRQP